MSETKTITSLYVITDTENSYDNIGDIDGGGFDTEWLKKHIVKYGTEGLFQQIAWMTFQVFVALREVNAEKSEATASVKAAKPEPPNFNPKNDN